MKKIVFILSLALFVFACNTTEKPAKEAETAEISIENLVEVSIPVHGMTCEGCENAVKKGVASLEGIAEVSASHIDSVAVVKFDKTLASLEDIKTKISEAGYTVAE